MNLLKKKALKRSIIMVTGEYCCPYYCAVVGNFNLT